MENQLHIGDVLGWVISVTVSEECKDDHSSVCYFLDSTAILDGTRRNSLDGHASLKRSHARLNSTKTGRADI